MRARDIENALARFHKWKPRTHALIPNLCSYVSHEVDLAVVHATGFMEAVEIKVSVSDFKREFTDKAERHERLLKGIPKYNYTTRSTAELVPDYSNPKPHTIKRFWFAVPADIAEAVKALVPEHAGLMVVHELPRKRYAIIVAKPAPTLKHHRKLEAHELQGIYRLGYLRYWDMRLLGKELPEAAV